jgi:hypothetical protein
MTPTIPEDYVVDMPPLSSKPALTFIEPKCKCCEHKHEKYVLVCTGCYENLMSEWKHQRIEE